ncbi:MAG: hypothetical protein II970_01260 [Paludibacteraceae bacterium]|nr:hypothetical protein [Paludibacteraceae bacterium]
MRTLIRLMLVPMVACLLFSCSKATADYTPYISFSAILRNPVTSHDSIIGCEDTVYTAYDSSISAYMLDTIALSDTVVFMAGFGSRGNDLTAALINFDSSAISLRCNLAKEIKAVLDTTKTDEQTAQLYFIPGYNFILFPITYSPKKAGVHKLVFQVRSDSKFSPVSYTLMQPVRE